MLCMVQPLSVCATGGGEVPFSQESTFYAEKYEIV